MGLATLGFGSLAAIGCGGDEFTAPQTSFDDPKLLEQFTSRGVGAYLVARCGTLDCHGQIGRPLRLYGSFGLRLESDGGVGLTPSGGGTTPEETYQNFLATIGVEPEETYRVFYEGGNPEALFLVSKPRNFVSHKGGAVIAPGQAGDVCMISWLEGDAKKDACDRAANLNTSQIYP